MIHVAKPVQADPDNIVFFLCGGFCTFDAEANIIAHDGLGADVDFVLYETRPPEGRDSRWCSICQDLHERRATAVGAWNRKVEAR